MYVIANYDVEAKKCPKVMKTLRRYLHHQQRSVFIGYITDADLRKLKSDIKSIIEKETDSVIFFELLSDKYLRTNFIGQEKAVKTIL